MTAQLKEFLAEFPADEAARIKTLLDRGIRIPAQPRILVELNKLYAREEKDVRVIARVVQQDTGIVAALFKVVQSPVYREHHPFDSVEHILQAVGLRQAYNLIQALALGDAVKLKKNKAAYEAYWLRSQAVAGFASTVAWERGSATTVTPDQAYLAGVFHDCGVPLLIERFPDYCKAMRADEPGRWFDLATEDKRFFADHAVVGYLVARHWRLPDQTCDAIRHHHDVDQLDAHAGRELIAILQVAMHMYYTELRVADPEWPQHKAAVMQLLDIPADSEVDYVDDLIECYNDMQRIQGG